MASRSAVWVFFRRPNDWNGEGKVLCEFPVDDDVKCGRTIRTRGHSTTPLNRHLNDHHPNWKEKAEDIFQKEHNQKSIAHFYKRKEKLRPRELRALFRQALVEGGIPFNFLRSRSLKRFLTSVLDSTEGYSPQTFRRELEREATSIRHDICRTLTKQDGVTICADIWTTSDNISFLGVICSWLDKRFMLHQHLIGFEEMVGRHTGDDILAALSNLCKRYSIEPSKQIAAIVMDSASANINAVKKWRESELCSLDGDITRPGCLLDGRGMVFIPCLAHILHNAVCEGLNRDRIRPVLEKVTSVISALRRKRNVLELYRSSFKSERSNPLAPVDNNRTRWHSTHAMLERFLAVFGKIKLAFEQAYEQNFIDDYAYKKAIQICNDADTGRLQDIHHVLTGIRCHARLLEAEHSPTMSSVFLSFCELREKVLNPLDSDSQEIKELKETILDGLVRRIQQFDRASTLVACIFDPRFIRTPAHILTLRKYMKFENCDDEPAKQDYEHIARIFQFVTCFWYERKDVPGNVEVPPPSEMTTSYVQNLQGAKDSASLLFTTNSPELTFGQLLHNEWLTYIKMSKQSGKMNSILEFWREQNRSLPLLSGLARLLLSVPASSAGAERVFSVAGWLRGVRQTRLTGNHFSDAMMARYHNLRQLDDDLDLSDDVPDSDEREVDLSIDE